MIIKRGANEAACGSGREVGLGVQDEKREGERVETSAE